ncbi:MAG: HlyD family efflux transporter periplasmic adaptor subunit [Flavobacteriales bacterium]|nr:HlyD family efflux transporter periplasmic adaptor subunit [Flavobacteriales bacterium]MCB9175193.1 HlyD family efflux transporter periplasmic adaptor subunit [Flavobacteriales bacterium]
MLNISQNRIDKKVDQTAYKSFSMVKNFRFEKVFLRLVKVFFSVVFLLMFLPWTQNIKSKGYVTTLKPDQRPQTINSVIAGKIEKWFVKEGDFVNKGDTILFISEIKDEYFDPNLLSNTEQQIQSKELTVKSYMEKVNSLDNQIDALIQTKLLKIEQAKNYIKQAELKILSDSVDLIAAKTNYDVAIKQFERIEKLYKDGLKSLTEVETRKLKLQETESKLISLENKLLSSRNELINAKVELTSINNQYIDKLSKAESEKYASLSSMYDAEAIVTKMQNQFMNYSVRSGLYYITANQDGIITKAIRTGLGETIKEGEEIVSIMPSLYDIAVEMYVMPMDLPLIKKNQPVRFMFDGWPTIVFSGWPNASFGTFGGKVVAIDNFISPNGKYRILVAPDKNDVKWPEGLRVGSGANGIALLKDVPIWYELWRNLNGFPPDYYTEKKELNNSENKIK